MDDSRIRQLTAEVLQAIRSAPGAASSPDLEARVAALEATVARLQGGRASIPEAVPEVHVHTHPALRVLNVPGGGDRCVMEPDRPCTQSHACRTLGH